MKKMKGGNKVELNICQLMNKLQDATIKLNKASTLEEMNKWENEISYYRNEIIELTNGK